MLKAFPECANCDRDDIAGVYQQHQTAWRIHLYDNFSQGLGLAAEFERDAAPYYLHTALEYVERCTCDDAGCPVCLFNFRAPANHAEQAGRAISAAAHAGAGHSRRSTIWNRTLPSLHQTI